MNKVSTIETPINKVIKTLHHGICHIYRVEGRSDNKSGHSKGPRQSGPIQAVPEGSVWCRQGISAWDRNNSELCFVSCFHFASYFCSPCSISEPQTPTLIYCYNLITSTLISELQYIRPHSETWSQVSHWCNPALTCSRSSDLTLPPIMSSLSYFLYEHCFTLPYLSFPVFPSVMPIYFCLTVSEPVKLLVLRRYT